MQFKTQFNAVIQAQTGQPINDHEINDLPSMTIPDQSLTPQEILVKFAQGRGHLVTENKPIYREQSIIDTSKMDFDQIDNIIKENRQNIKDMEAYLQAQQKELQTKIIKDSIQRKTKANEPSKNNP